MTLNQIYENEQFRTFYNMLIETNKQFNLTSITDEREVYLKHFLDCVFVEKEFEQNARVLDVGTGAGFPAVPLAICRPDLKITAIDALNKRINFVNSVKNELKLTNLTAMHARSEEIAQKNRETFDIATSRAVAGLNSLLELLAPLVKVGGKIICYKGPQASEEIERSKNAEKELGLKLEKVKEYSFGAEQISRFLVVYKKIASTPKRFPRPANKAIKQPIV